jgi:hypothetical protein
MALRDSHCLEYSNVGSALVPMPESRRSTEPRMDPCRRVLQMSVAAKFTFLVHSHMLRHACGFKLANDGHDTRAIQAYLGHRSIMSARAGAPLLRVTLQAVETGGAPSGRRKGLRVRQREGIGSASSTHNRNPSSNTTGMESGRELKAVTHGPAF